MAHKPAGQQVVVRPVESEQQLAEFRRVTRAYLVSRPLCRARGHLGIPDRSMEQLTVAVLRANPMSLRQAAAAAPPPARPPPALARMAPTTCNRTQEWLGEDLSFQQIEAELASLPGSYAEDAGGCMLLAYAPVGASGDASSSSSDASCGAAAGSGSGDAAPGLGSSGAASASTAGEEVIGAVALRRLVGHTPTLGPGDGLEGVPLEGVCEMKRLFVLEHHHGLGAGAALARALLGAAAARGYRLMVLDTLERLGGANRLYRRLGFQPCQRYNDCPLPGVLYFARRLGGERSEPGSQLDGGSGPQA